MIIAGHCYFHEVIQSPKIILNLYKLNPSLIIFQILKEIEENDIGIYRFPDLGGEDDEDVAAVSMKVWKK